MKRAVLTILAFLGAGMPAVAMFENGVATNTPLPAIVMVACGLAWMWATDFLVD